MRAATGQELPLVVANRLAAIPGKADGEPRARTVARQPLGPVLACDAYRCVQRKATVLPGEPVTVTGSIGIDQPVAGEPTRHAAAHLLFDHGNLFFRTGAGEAIGQDAALEIIALRNSLLAPP